jgi:signal transduction histidine kinase
MICNDLVMPVMLRWPILGLAQKSDLSNVLLAIRRGSIVLVLLLGYVYYRFVGEYYSLVSIGLISFVAVTQFAPSILGGIFWKRGTKAGALSGLIAGFLVWAYTLVIPSLVQAGFLPTQFVSEGPFGITLLKPFQLFGLTDLDHIAHAVFWSMLANSTMFVGVSLFGEPSAIEHTQATFFVDVFKYSVDTGGSSLWRGTAQVGDLRSLLNRFLGAERTEKMLAEYANQHAIDLNQSLTADAALVSHVEKLLAGTIGSASARVVVGTVAKEEPLGIDEVMNILDETRQVIAYSRELEIATNELKAANERLKELDRLKDEFISTVTHELRTPLTSVRSIAEILHANPKLNNEQHQSFTSIIVKESERLTRLINQVLDFQKIETGAMDWHISHLNLNEVIQDALATTNQLIQEKKIEVECRLPDEVPLITGDRDRLIQALVNLISNAVKFCRDNHGKIDIDLHVAADRMQVNVRDNGIGISETDKQIIFDEFRQVRHVTKGRPRGSGLGLAITRRIIDFHNGRIWVESTPGKGSTFSFSLPIEAISIEV